jgi:hypothetical protein
MVGNETARINSIAKTYNEKIRIGLSSNPDKVRDSQQYVSYQ